MAVKIGSARSDERGKITGGKAGDQKNGLEVSTQSWYDHSKGWVMLRCIDPAKAEIIAKTMEKVCASNRVGYDQTGRNDLYKALKDKNFDMDKLTKDVETDCSALVVFCCAAAGIKDISTSTITSNLATNLVKTGYFKKYTESKYTKQDDYLHRGDVLVTKTKGHTVVVLTNGDKADTVPEPAKKYDLGERILRNGSEGNDVKELQEYLNQLGYDCGLVDGEFGDNTEIGLREFQTAKKLEVDGEYGPKSHAAMMDALADKVIKNPRKVRIVNGNCYVRKAPNKGSNPALGIAKKGEVYTYGGEMSSAGWHLIEYKGKNGWVSGMYSELEE